MTQAPAMPPPLPVADLAWMHERDRAARARRGGYQTLAETDRAALLREVGRLRALTAVLAPRHAALKPILRLKDHRDRDGLLKTLAAWVETGGTGRAAEALHCHHNTVYYRLGRIERLTKLDRTVPGDLADLVLALRRHEAGIVVDLGEDDRPAEAAR